jgi:lysophospholipase L1-like esterase
LHHQRGHRVSAEEVLIAGDAASSGARGSILKRVLGASAVVVVSSAVALGIAEVVVRIVAPQTLPSQTVVRSFVLKGMFLPDEKAGYVPAGNYEGRIERGEVVTDFRTNSLGLRAPELDAPTPGRTRIAVFGDSFVFGWGAPQGKEWVALAGEAVDARSARDAVEMVNCGVNGYGTENELLFLRRVGRAVDPDVVLLGFFANDYMDNLLGATGFYTVVDGYLFDRWTHDYFQESTLARESHLVRLAQSGWGEARRKWLGIPPQARPVRNFSARDFADGARLSAQHILAMKAACDSLGARFGVVWLPPDEYALARQPPDVAEQRWLMQQVRAAGIPSLDLLPIVRAHRDPRSLYYAGDGHFTAEGNRVAGEAVAEWILDAGFLGP